MWSADRYHRAVDAALQLLAVVRDRPDAEEHILVSHFVFTILSAIAEEEERRAAEGHGAAHGIPCGCKGGRDGR